MTRRTFQPSFGPLKIEPPSPERLQTRGTIDSFDNMSAQSSDSTYMSQRHHRQNSSWTSPSQYSDLVSNYGHHQRTPCTIQTQIPLPKAEANLPSIHDLTYAPAFPTPNSYTYGNSTGAYNDHRSYPVKTESSYPIKTEVQTYYEAQNRYGQHYSQMNRPSAAHLDCQRYPGIYEYPKSMAFPSPYTVDYISSPTGSHHPVSPTVSNGDGCGLGPGGRKRRGNLPKHITDFLKGWFMAHLEHPYPSEDDKQAFVQETGLTIAQVRISTLSEKRLG